MTRFPSATAMTVALFACLPATAQHSSIKVQLFTDMQPTSIAIISEGGLSLYADTSNEALATVPASDTVWVRRGAIDLRTTAGGLLINMTDLYLMAGASGAFVVQTDQAGGAGVSRRFSGTLHVSNDAGRGRLRVVNEVDLETYVAAVVGKEYDLDDGEGARAMAIVARTFGARAIREGDGVATDGLASQVYRGLDAITDASRAAAESTRGMILTYDDAPIVAVYSASNGGHSANNADVWAGSPLPYLRARKDRYDRKASPHNDWTLRAPAEEVHALLEPIVGKAITSIEVNGRSRDGRVQWVSAKTVDGVKEEISGTDFRVALSRKYGATSLRSTKFEVDRRGNDYEFKGSGFGHGVGLSQWGAHEMSDRGYNHVEILDYYYPGAKLSTLESVETPAFPAFTSVPRPATRRADDSSDRLASAEPPQREHGQAIGWTRGATGRDHASSSQRRWGW